jgi:NTP pyrophosphatase (non-canonical NTP hydrolase)
MDKTKYLSFVKSIEKPGDTISLDSLQKRQTHAALGMAGETGETVDIVKKHVIYGKPLDKNKVIEECGDILYYMAVLLDTVDSNIDEAIFENYKKLSARYYKGSYTNEQAIERKDKGSEL